MGRAFWHIQQAFHRLDFLALCTVVSLWKMDAIWLDDSMKINLEIFLIILLFCKSTICLYSRRGKNSLADIAKDQERKREKSFNEWLKFKLKLFFRQRGIIWKL